MCGSPVAAAASWGVIRECATLAHGFLQPCWVKFACHASLSHCHFLRPSQFLHSLMSATSLCPAASPSAAGVASSGLVFPPFSNSCPFFPRTCAPGRRRRLGTAHLLCSLGSATSLSRAASPSPAWLVRSGPRTDFDDGFWQDDEVFCGRNFSPKFVSTFGKSSLLLASFAF